MTQQVMQIDGDGEREGDLHWIPFQRGASHFAPSHAILSETTVDPETLFFQVLVSYHPMSYDCVCTFLCHIFML